MLRLNNKKIRRFFGIFATKKCQKSWEKSNNLSLTYCGRHLIFFAQDGGGNVTKPETEVIQKRQFITTPAVAAVAAAPAPKRLRHGESPLVTVTSCLLDSMAAGAWTHATGRRTLQTTRPYVNSAIRTTSSCCAQQSCKGGRIQ